MVAIKRFNSALTVCACLTVFFSAAVFSDGMRPDTTVVVLNEADGEVSINVTNTDKLPALLHSAIEDLPEDLEALIVVTPPVTRVDAGERQMVRFLSIAKEPLKTQRLKRVSFEGIPPAQPGSGATIGISLRQNLPLILHPKELPRHEAPWELLTWHLQGRTLTVRNDSPYVVRLAADVRLNPQAVKASLSRTYILPGEALSVELKKPVPGSTSVTLEPATVYGFVVDSYDALLVANAP